MVKQDWGTPNWENAEEYPKPELSDVLWHWEFLRRKPAYRQDWLDNYQASIEHCKLSCQNSYFAKDKHLLEEHLAKCDPHHPEFRAFFEGSIQKYGLHGIPNPAIKEPANLFFSRHIIEDDPPQLWAGPLTEGNPYTYSDNGEITVHPNGSVVFDLEKPLKPQIDQVYAQLKDLQEARTGRLLRDRDGVPKRDFPLMLRILDAREAGVSFARIGMELLDTGSSSSESAAHAKSKHETALHLFD